MLCQCATSLLLFRLHKIQAEWSLLIGQIDIAGACEGLAGAQACTASPFP